MLNKIRRFLLNYPLEILLFSFFSVFSFWLMLHTFSYEEDKILIGSRLWSDFASHIPVIRSFSLGSNFPPEYALFPGEPMRFHFLFYAFVGLLEKIGFRLDYALNIPSALGFAGLLIMLYVFAKKIFNSAMVGILSVIFFLFNGSLSFLFFLKDHPLSITTINDIIRSNAFSSFGPYDQNIISAFWNLNIYTNQRHLGLSYGLSLLLIYILINPLFAKKQNEVSLKKLPKFLGWVFGEKIDTFPKFLLKNVLLGILLSLFFYLHLGVFTFTVVIVCVLALLFRDLRLQVLIILAVGFLLSIPQYLYQTSGGSTFNLFLKPGYLIFEGLTLKSFTNYWVLNLGLPLFLMIAGFIVAPVKLKRIFLAFFTLFIIGNLFQFSPEIAGNHKFFNFFMIGGVMFAAYFLVKIWRKNLLGKIVVIVTIFFSTLSGIIDFFPIYNDRKIELPDYKINKDSSWILNKTAPDSVFLNTTFLYDPASLAGRKIFMGWPYFAWSAGYDTDGRGKIMKDMLGAKDKTTACGLLKENKIDYVEITIQNPPDPNIPPISSLYENDFIKSYVSKEKKYSIYRVDTNCSGVK